ncbi:MAG: outer membrane beta-barrel protein [bacterium]|nr:outer membrane beta-barrel protein [bacterium]
MKRTMCGMILLLTLLVAGAAVAEGAKISGFVDAAWTYEAAAKAGVFGLDQVEVDVEHQAGERTLVRADLEWLKDGEGYLAQVEQAYVEYEARCGWRLSFGKFNAPIGYEVLDPTGMYQYSHSLLFTYVAPTNLTGVKVARVLGGGLDLAVHLSNGWDRATADKYVTVGGRLGLAHGGFSGGLAAISGKEDTPAENPDDPSSPLTRSVVDADLTFVHGAWRFGGEASLGDVETAGGKGRWFGLMAMTHFDFSPRAGLTLRVDQLDDRDGQLFEPVGDQYRVRRSLTVAPTFVLDDGLGALIEFRIDHLDRDGFLDADGEPTDRAMTIAVEMTGSW